MSHGFGRTRWKRFAVVLGAGVTAAAALGIGMAQGALAASFFISGQRFQVGADTIKVRGLSIYGMVDVTKKGTLVPVAVTGLRSAKISGLCQSVVVPIPVLGPYTLRLTGGDRSPTEAKNMFIDATSLSAGQANLDDLDIGVAAGAVSKGPINPEDRDSRFFDPNGVAQQAVSAVLTDVRTTAVAVSAATLNIPELDLRLKQGRRECF
ncbi:MULTISPECIES: DUF6230 family protein [unclassified Streptomyces]|uniref:DUF6230 family protein n=1 Tax=unclassified Streptomyces TaxID=2593676 RepID=UPI002DDB2645|nr:DUF6230 family protein [Streptomyces sp. NBC_01750]WSB04903.1 DUF6230 family protein [Streptomyces sp. NBC_01794]WSD30820.1 DUF6230 family protein [Streptomyces sp. NBC_01750]